MIQVHRKLRCACRRLIPQGTLGKGDRRLLHWILLCVTTLLTIVILMVSGALAALRAYQVELLQSAPFYMAAEETQILLLEPLSGFYICLALVLYLAAVLLREPRLGRRTQVAALALLAAVLPGLICVLWGGVLPVSAFACSVLTLWVLTVPASALHTLWRHWRTPS